MTGREDVQSFIERLDAGVVGSEEVEAGLWVLTPEQDGARIVVNYEPPVVVFRVNVMQLPPEGEKRNQLMRKLLQLNATELLHGSYGIEDDSVVLTDALQLENLDFSEFQASIESISLALASHMAALAPYRE
jgi:CesT_Tir_1